MVLLKHSVEIASLNLNIVILIYSGSRECNLVYSLGGKDRTPLLFSMLVKSKKRYPNVDIGSCIHNETASALLQAYIAGV